MENKEISNNSNEKKNLRKSLMIAVMAGALILIGILGAYAFYVASVTSEEEKVTVQTGNMALSFSDGTAAFTGGELDFGESATKTFSITNSGSLDALAKINWKNLTNTYIEGSLTYTLSYAETESGTYTNIVTNKKVPRSATETTKTLANELTVPAGKTYYYKLVITLNYLETIDQTADLSSMLATEFAIEEGSLEPEKGMAVQISEALANKTTVPENLVKSTTPTFAEASITDETADGLYAMADDYGTSYYYRGAVENNYVKFAGFWWRIIRVNGDGSLRIIYDGDQAYTNGTSQAKRLALSGVAWNTISNDTKYVGYMYGGSNGTASTKRIDLGQTGYEDSTNAIYNETDTNIKTQLEAWYKTNIVDKGYDSYVSDEIFCNDRSFESRNTGTGIGASTTCYGARGRTGESNGSVAPQFTCPNKNDAFTKSNTEKGNGKLNQKVGLITADEVVAAGSGKIRTSNSSYYLYKGNWYWAGSPYNYTGLAYVFYVNDNGYLSFNDVYAVGGVVPVINLSAEYVATMIGDGTIGNEYRDE